MSLSRVEEEAWGADVLEVMLPVHPSVPSWVSTEDGMWCKESPAVRWNIWSVVGEIWNLNIVWIRERGFGRVEGLAELNWAAASCAGVQQLGGHPPTGWSLTNVYLSLKCQMATYFFIGSVPVIQVRGAGTNLLYCYRRLCCYCWERNSIKTVIIELYYSVIFFLPGAGRVKDVKLRTLSHAVCTPLRLQPRRGCGEAVLILSWL